MSVPSSIIRILSGVPLNSAYEHSLYFEDRAAQTTYFLGQTIKTFSNYTYLRPGNIIKVAGDVANARAWNYLMFQNDKGKWYYHFIDKVVYLNDSAVELHLTLDVIQTFMFDWDLKPCFIERSHTRSDKFGENVVPEGLETGPLARLAETNINLEDNCILLLMACDKNGNNAWGKAYGGVYSGLAVYAVQYEDISEFNGWLAEASEGGYIDAIVSMWMYPKKLVNVSGGWSSTTLLHTVTGVDDTIEAVVDDPLWDSNTIDGVLVRNKKTFCYPYTMLYISNNMGGCATFRRELFEPETPGKYKFSVFGALSPDSGVQLVPEFYNQRDTQRYSFEEALSMPPFPTCAWNSDTYKVWLAQNQNTQSLAQKQAVVQAGIGVAMGVGSALMGNIGGALGGAGTAYNALTNVQSLMAQRADMAIQPDQARGNHSGNINLTHGRMGYTAYIMGLSREYVAIVDNYFTRYGYKLNTVNTPSLHNRELFTFIKTVGCLVTGAFGAEDQVTIQNIFDKGITFWSDPLYVGEYHRSNRPLSEVN